jgi:flagellar hook-length control protein FliK
VTAEDQAGATTLVAAQVAATPTAAAPVVQAGPATTTGAAGAATAPQVGTPTTGATPASTDATVDAATVDAATVDDVIATALPVASAAAKQAGSPAGSSPSTAGVVADGAPGDPADAVTTAPNPQPGSAAAAAAPGTAGAVSTNATAADSTDAAAPVSDLVPVDQATVAPDAPQEAPSTADQTVDPAEVVDPSDVVDLPDAPEVVTPTARTASGENTATAQSATSRVAAGARAENRSSPSATPPPFTAPAESGDDLLAKAELNRLSNGGSRLGIDMTTTELGAVRVEASRRAGLLHLDLMSDQSVARSLLVDHADELRNEMRASGLDLNSLDVRSQGRQGGSASDLGRPQDFSGEPRARREGDADVTFGPASPQAEAPGMQVAGAAGVDLRL